MRKWALLLVLACVPVAAQGLFGPSVDAVKGRLDDPYSVKFEGVRKVANGAVCGQYNAKNQYGAYAGRKEFAIVDGVAYLEGSDSEEAVIVLHCIRGYECKDAACMEDVKAQISKEAANAEASRNVGALRLSASQSCTALTATNPGRMLECSNLVRECRKKKYAVDEADCLAAAIDQYQ